MTRAAHLIVAALAIGCSASHVPGDAGGRDEEGGARDAMAAGTDVAAPPVTGTCNDQWDALHGARERYVGLTPLACGPDFGHCSECFYDYSCADGLVFIRVNGVRCDVGVSSLDAGPDAP